MVMIRRNFFIPKSQNAFLKTQKDITVSEHIRTAIAQYIDRIKNVNAVSSPSKVKKG